MKSYTCVPGLEAPQSSQPYSLDTETFCIEADPVDQKSYRASAETAVLGALTLARVHTMGAVVSRKHEEFMDLDYKRFSMVYVVEGELMISHHLGTSALRAGEFTLLDNSHPRKMLVKNQVSLLLVNTPREVLKRYLPTPETCLGLTMRAAADSGGRDEPVFAPLLAMWEKLKSGSLREFAPSLSENFLTLAARLYMSRFPSGGSTALRRVAEVKRAIEAQLCDPELSVEVIADGMGVTSRYLRGLFHGSEKLSHLILRRRLEECANRLHDPLCWNSSISTIAKQSGFTSAAHFSRAFRKQFGYTPRDFRKKATPSAAKRTT